MKTFILWGFFCFQSEPEQVQVGYNRCLRVPVRPRVSPCRPSAATSFQPLARWFSPLWGHQGSITHSHPDHELSQNDGAGCWCQRRDVPGVGDPGVAPWAGRGSSPRSAALGPAHVCRAAASATFIFLRPSRTSRNSGRGSGPTAAPRSCCRGEPRGGRESLPGSPWLSP